MSAITSDRSGSTMEQFLLGARMFVPVALSVAAYGLVWGVLARQAGLSVVDVLLMSALVYSGTAQFVALDLWAPEALPVGAIVLAATIVNLRLMLMTATLRPLAAHLPLWRAAFGMGLVADETWAMTMGEVAKGRGSFAYLMGSGVVCYLAWLLATLAGRLLGSAIDDPSRYGLDFAFTATFLALLFGMWKGKSDLVPWTAAALAAIAAAKLAPGNWHIIVGGLTGSLVGAIIETRMGRRHVA